MRVYANQMGVIKIYFIIHLYLQRNESGRKRLKEKVLANQNLRKMSAYDSITTTYALTKSKWMYVSFFLLFFLSHVILLLLFFLFYF